MPYQTRANAEEQIKALVTKYETEAASGGFKQYSEEDIKKGFIEPLFEVLGWDIGNRSEVSTEEHIKSSGSPDYGFYLRGRCRFYLEAKSVKADIDDPQWARQAIRYSWNKGITWAVLTNFKRLKVFNAQDPKSSLHDKQLFDISYTEYLSRFDDVWLLSKASFLANALDAYAEKIGKKYQKIPVSDTLYKDLNECREELTRSLAICNPDVKPDDLDEGVQKLLDRLIFLRVAEDRNVEPNILKQLLRESEHAKNGSFLYEAMTKQFRELDRIYNSNLFQVHPFEKWEEYGGATKKTVKILYGKEGYYDYDFKVMPADVLGTVYENYLSYRLSQERSKKKLFKEMELDKDAGKRKEQGIYYTPTYIVDYIVRHALTPILDTCDTIEKLMRVKVVDPACGSGSFLIKALEVLNEKYMSLGEPGDESTKLIAIINNIYGVDLDRQAVEIARLNLLINSLDKRMKFPPLTDNIKCGNSLISGTNAELKKHFGAGFREKEPFNWEEQFPSVFAQGGFDVVIGNPPWGAGLELAEKDFYKTNFVAGKGIIDTFALFIEQSMRLLNNAGRWGFVLPDIVLLKDYPHIRKLILDNSVITDIYYTGMAFHDVNLDSVIMVARKEPSKEKRSEHTIVVTTDRGESKIEQQLFLENTDYKFNLYFDDTSLSLKKKMDEQSNRLGDILEIHEGIHSGNVRAKLFLDSATNNKCQKLLFKGVEVKKYFEKWAGKFVNYDKSIIDKANGEYANLGKEGYFKSDKILVRRTGDKIIATLDRDAYFVSNNFFVLYPKTTTKKINLKDILAVLNSKLGTWYFTAIQPRRGKLFAEIKINHLAEIPLPKLGNFKEIESLVDSMFELQKESHSSEENSNEWERLKSEIEKTDKKIDTAVYELYGLTKDDIKTIEAGDQ